MEQGRPSKVAFSDQPGWWRIMAEQRNSLKRDFGIFMDPGFLVTLLLLGLLAAGGIYLLVHAANEYGVPLRPYWQS